MPHHAKHLNGDDCTLHTRRSFRRRMTWDGSLPDHVVAALWNCPDELLRQGECLQTKSRTSVVRLQLSSRSYLFKYHYWAGFWKTLAKSRATSPNRHSFDLGVQLSDAGVPTPRPLACVDMRLGPFNVCSYLLTEFVEGTSLYRFLRHGRLDAATIDDFARQVARIWQQLDDMRLSHNDLKPENFMVDPSGRVWLIDLENANWHKDAKSLRRAQAADAERLMHIRSWQANPAAAEVFRQRLLETPAVQAAIAEQDGRPHPLASPTKIGAEAVQRLTVLISCGNDVHEICGCVEDVRDFADEILVVVAGSNDGTWELAKSLSGCRAIRFAQFDADTQRRAIAAVSHPWVLMIRPAERVSPDLAKEIQFVLASNPAVEEFCVERRNYLFGQPVRFGDLASDMPVRLVRKDAAVLPSVISIDTKKLPKGVGKLRGRIFHHRARTVDEWLMQLMERAENAAEALHENGKRPSLTRVLFQAPLSLLRSYFVKLGCLDGQAGLHAALMSAVFEYVRYAKLWQLERGLPRQVIGIAESPRLKLLDPGAADAEHASIREFGASESQRAA